MKKIPKTKDQRIFKAVEDLRKAIAMEDPDIQIKLYAYRGHIDEASNKEFGKKIKAFADEYKKFYGLKKVKIELGIE